MLLPTPSVLIRTHCTSTTDRQSTSQNTSMACPSLSWMVQKWDTSAQGQHTLCETGAEQTRVVSSESKQLREALG